MSERNVTHMTTLPADEQACMVEAPERIFLIPMEGTRLQPGTTQQRAPWWDFDNAAWATDKEKDIDVEYTRSDIAEREFHERVTREMHAEARRILADRLKRFSVRNGLAAVAGVGVAVFGFYIAWCQLSATTNALQASNAYTIQRDARQIAGEFLKSVKKLESEQTSPDEHQQALVELWKMFNFYLAVYRQAQAGGIGSNFAESFGKDFCDTIKRQSVAAAWDELKKRNSLNDQHIKMRETWCGH